MMKTYCDEHCINIVELFSRFDADGSMSVTHEEFKLGLKVIARVVLYVVLANSHRVTNDRFLNRMYR